MLLSRVRAFRGVFVPQRIQEFLVAAVGEGISEVEVLEWHVKPGDQVNQFDKVCDVQTDKATVEITSRYDGIVKSLNYKTGDIAKVGTSLMTLDVEGDDSSSSVASSKSEDKEIKADTKSHLSLGASFSSDKVLTTPAVRKIAKEHNLDLSKVVPSGPGGRIVKADVLKAAGILASDEDDLRVVASSVPETSAGEVKPVGQDRVQKISGIQRIMVQTMTQAAKVPTLGFCEEIVMNNLVRMRSSLKDEAAKMNVKLSFLPFILKATSAALSEFPILNSHVNEDCSAVTIRASHNIGLAMDTPRGLLVPNVKNVEQLSVLEIAKELNRLQDLGSAGKLGQDDLNGGTFTLSNIGSIGGTYASPILVVPQVAIGALGRIRKLPRFDSQGNVVAESIMEVSWSADHRVIDGATIARFNNSFKRFLEHPELLLLYSR